jgi:hypothetical protein
MGTYSDVVRSAATVTDDDGNGIVTWNPSGGVQLRSIWVAIDLGDGSHTVATPAGYTAIAVNLTAANLPSTGGAGASALAFEGDSVHFAVIRPGTGGWHAVAGPDGATELASVSVSGLQLEQGENIPVEDPPPTELENGDVVVMINSFRGTYGVALIGE